MLKDILPEFIYAALENIDIDQIQELRLRVGKPLVVYLAGKMFYLSFQGLTASANDAILTRKKNITDILLKCSNNSLYTINDQLINGYVSYGGIRIGVSGEVVSEQGSITTLKNITSLNIRIPHEVKNCSLPVYDLLVANGRVLNTLIVSAPGMGKTTFLRDFAYQLSCNMPQINLLIIDERAEITGISGGNSSFEFVNADIYTSCNKLYGFTNGIRSMRPDVILTDELNLDMDLQVIIDALTCGVNVVATIHANSIEELKNKKGFKQLLDLKIIDRFVLLGTDRNVGSISGVFNSNLSCIYV